MIENKDKWEEPIALRSSAVQEILGLVPNWMIRWGNTLILFLIIGAFSISYFVKYPTTITCKVALSTAESTENLYAGIDGTFSKLNVPDGARVNSEELLGIINASGVEMLVKSKTSGRVYFVDFWKIGLSVERGDLLFRIVPSNHGFFTGKLKVPMNQTAKIKKGQQVRIYLSESDMLEYDIVQGVVQNISTVPDADGFLLVEVKLGEKLVTINDKEIIYAPGKIGKAEIIVEELRLIERFFYQLKNIFYD